MRRGREDRTRARDAVEAGRHIEPTAFRQTTYIREEVALIKAQPIDRFVFRRATFQDRPPFPASSITQVERTAELHPPPPSRRNFCDRQAFSQPPYVRAAAT